MGESSQLLICFIQEFLAVHNDTLVGAAADLTGFVKGLDLEGDDLALHSGDRGFGANFQTHGGS